MTHEDFTRKLPTRDMANRTFGLVLGGVLSVVALAPLVRSHSPRWWAAVPAALLLLLALAAPALLGPLKKQWMRFAHVMNIIVSHVISALLLYGIFAPVGFFLRLRGEDLLRLRWDKQAATYWIPRNPPGPAPQSMTNQF